jgi:aspartate ammonia-lyase
MLRTEKDSLGEKQMPADALYGINAVRASENFPPNLPFPIEWYKSIGLTKAACYRTCRKFTDAAREKKGESLTFRIIPPAILDALESSAIEVSQGRYFEFFIIPAVQGGAGTSINMNINEIICNSALLKTGHKCGEYEYIDPVEDANVYQSTNDIVPTALTVAAMTLLIELESSINSMRNRMEELERTTRENMRQSYTEMQYALPSSFGALFSAYNEALSRDWWRVSKTSERIKQVNLGGGAAGTGLSIPRYFIMESVPELRELTGLPLSHSENLPDATSNLDKWVEIHAILKAHAVNLEKISSDIRLLSSDIAGLKTIIIPEKQVGSSIMPGKINPVIPEFIISAAHKIYSNDVLISSLCGQGTLDLNAYLPLVGYTMIESIRLLTSCNKSLHDHLLAGIKVEADGYGRLIKSPAITTALLPYTGYHKAAELAQLMKEQNLDVFEANAILGTIDHEKLKIIMQPGNLMKLGFSIDEL